MIRSPLSLGVSNMNPAMPKFVLTSRIMREHFYQALGDVSIGGMSLGSRASSHVTEVQFKRTEKLFETFRSRLFEES